MTNESPLGRRPFLAGSAALMATTWPSRARAQSANDELVVAVIGTGGRGRSLGAAMEGLPGVSVKAVFDVDELRARQAANTIGKVRGRSIDAGQDFRVILEDDDVDAVVVATSNHWHAPAALLAISAGKHAYVEKPCSHNPHEGELLVAAAKKYGRVVQHGTQRRSRPGLQQGIARLHAGVIGRVYYAHCYYRNVRPSIGNGTETAPPENLNFDLWQGPAPRQAYRDNILHYHWHWFWHWGNGELGNNGVHFVDMARAALEVDFPIHVTSTGGRFRWPDDDQESPDTQLASFKFENDKLITWEALSCNRQRPGQAGDELWVYGENGSAAFTDSGFRIYDARNKEIEQHDDRGGDRDHLLNFVAAIRGETQLNAPITEGHKSALLCHLGNISYRTGRSLQCDSTNGKILDDDEAMTFWKREYQAGWEPSN